MQGGLEFSFLGIPIRVLPPFFLMAIVLGLGYQDFSLTAIWVAVVFVSVLLHELGHALMYRRFGSSSAIVLHSFGGMTMGTSQPLGRDLAVSLAGPGASLLIGLPLLAVARAGLVADGRSSTILAMVIWVNVGWALLNLMPILPLDGGHALVSLLSMATKRDATRAVQVVSIAVAGLAVVVSLRFGLVFTAVLAGLFAFMNIQGLSRQAPWKVTRPVRANHADAGALATTTPAVHGASSGGSPNSGPISPPASPPLAPPTHPPVAEPGPVTAAPGATAPPIPSPPPIAAPAGTPSNISGRRSLDEEAASAVKAVLAHEPELALIAVGRIRSHDLSSEQAAKADELEAWAWLERGDVVAARPLVDGLLSGSESRRYLEIGLAVLASEPGTVIDRDDPALSAQFLHTLVDGREAPRP